MNQEHQSSSVSEKVFVDIATSQFCIPITRSRNPEEIKFLLGTSVQQTFIPFDPTKSPCLIEENHFCKCFNR